MNTREMGIFQKFNVHRVDGRDGAGDKHNGCDYFVLDLTHDKHAMPALVAYAESCQVDYPQLAGDLRTKAIASIAASNEFVTVPAVTLPNGIVVESFEVGKYLSSRGPLAIPSITASGKPWVEVDYHDASSACVGAGLRLITELQWLAIAHDIVNQDINWTGGKVGEGEVFKGLHKGTVTEATSADHVSANPAERRWHQLSNGQQIFDFSGNACSWVFDNVQGNADGLVAKAFNAASPSISTAPAPSRKSGMGWQPKPDANWSGYALLRGGCWFDGDDAGVFALGVAYPDRAYDDVGFRCTKPNTGL